MITGHNAPLISRFRKLSRAELLLFALFILTLPFITPRIDWDGNGYYAYARSLIFDHNLQFKGDWKGGGTPMIAAPGKNGVPQKMYITKTGHISNYLAVGPAMLWAPFVAMTRAGVLAVHHGQDIPGDGHGPPYERAVCFASALYGFLGLWISFRLACEFVGPKWALLATISIWFASSLTFYMYSDASWAHADSVFAVALFLWCWARARNAAPEAPWRWAIWGLAAGLMCDVYFPNSVFLLLPALELFVYFRKSDDRMGAMKTSLLRGFRFAASFLIAFSPTLIMRQIIFGNPLSTGAYGSKPWAWTSPHFGGVLFSPDHGAFTTTPILIIAAAGLFLLWRNKPSIGSRLTMLVVAFWCLIAVYPWWDGLVSFGSRFFVSLAPIFVIGLAAAFERFTSVWRDSRAAMHRAAVVSALLIIWNFGLVYQLDHGLFMQIGPVDWQNAVYNQFRTVPGMVVQDISAKFSHHANLREQAQAN